MGNLCFSALTVNCSWVHYDVILVCSIETVDTWLKMGSTITVYFRPFVIVSFISSVSLHGQDEFISKVSSHSIIIQYSAALSIVNLYYIYRFKNITQLNASWKHGNKR